MPYNSGLREAIWKTRFFLICLAFCVIGALAGIQRGFACANIPGLGAFTGCYQYDTCSSGEPCLVVTCDGAICAEGPNGGQICYVSGYPLCGCPE